LVAAADAIRALQAFIDDRWALAQPKFYPDVADGPRVHPEVTPAEAAYFLASVATDGREPPLFRIDDDGLWQSDRFPPKVDGQPRIYHFFEAGRLRLEDIVHGAAMARLRDEFGWPREHLICESPAVVDEDGSRVVGGEALDILLLEKPCTELRARMTIATLRSRAGVEAKANKNLLDKLFQEMRACQMGSHSQHNKCLAIDAFRVDLFLGVAAGETWRLFSVAERNGRAVLGDELPDLDRLHFKH
jgi:hypothetical protein